MPVVYFFKPFASKLPGGEEKLRRFCGWYADDACELWALISAAYLRGEMNSTFGRISLTAVSVMLCSPTQWPMLITHTSLGKACLVCQRLLVCAQLGGFSSVFVDICFFMIFHCFLFDSFSSISRLRLKSALFDSFPPPPPPRPSRELPHHAIREPADRQRHSGGRGALQVRRLQPRHSGGQDVHLRRPPAHSP